ncbi:MAG: hypothetical protein PVJ66_09935 [Gammaproteobacteria bacterium]|jgi:hypothetical protein
MNRQINQSFSGKCVLICALLVIPGVITAQPFVRDDIITDPAPERFSVCFDHSCRTVTSLSLSDREWAAVIAPLVVPAAGAAGERTAIAAAIAVMESVVGEHTGTSRDRGGNIRGFGQPRQMDCIDESTNTHTYLYMLEKAGYFRHHRLVDRITRFGLFVGMPHTTAVIEDLETGTRFAVDSWFYDNGQPPPVIEVSEWKSGWRPGQRRP